VCLACLFGWCGSHVISSHPWTPRDKKAGCRCLLKSMPVRRNRQASFSLSPSLLLSPKEADACCYGEKALSKQKTPARTLPLSPLPTLTPPSLLLLLLCRKARQAEARGWEWLGGRERNMNIYVHRVFLSLSLSLSLIVVMIVFKAAYYFYMGVCASSILPAKSSFSHVPCFNQSTLPTYLRSFNTFLLLSLPIFSSSSPSLPTALPPLLLLPNYP